MGVWEVAAVSEERDEDGGVWARLEEALTQQVEIVRAARETLERAEELDEEVGNEDR